MKKFRYTALSASLAGFLLAMALILGAARSLEADALRRQRLQRSLFQHKRLSSLFAHYMLF